MKTNAALNLGSVKTGAVLTQLAATGVTAMRASSLDRQPRNALVGTLLCHNLYLTMITTTKVFSEVL